MNVCGSVEVFKISPLLGKYSELHYVGDLQRLGGKKPSYDLKVLDSIMVNTL